MIGGPAQARPRGEEPLPPYLGATAQTDDRHSRKSIQQTIPSPPDPGYSADSCCTTVAGTLKLQGRTDHGGIQVLMWPGAGLRSTTDSSGQFTITDVPAFASAETPVYTIDVTFPGYLTPKTSLDLQTYRVDGQLPAEVIFPELWLLAGDLNGDHRINIFDLVIIGSHYGDTGASPADINGDGRVNIQDLALSSGNFGRDNQYSWSP